MVFVFRVDKLFRVSFVTLKQLNGISKVKKTLTITDVVAIVDSREQLPLDLQPLQVERRKLDTGDYSLKNYEHLVAIERKSLSDLVGSATFGRERFDRCIARLKEYRYKALVIEADWSSIELKQYRGSTNPMALFGSLMGWALSDISVIFAGDRRRAGLLIARLLWVSASRIHKEEYKRWTELSLKSADTKTHAAPTDGLVG